MSAPFPMLVLDEVDSTNAEALRRAASGETGPLWIRTDLQTAGRGRSGRTWMGAPGNLAATLLLSPGCPAAALHQLSFVSGIAVFDAVERYRAASSEGSAPPLFLKWPNDLMAGGYCSRWAKLGGILIESTTNVSGVLVAAIGIGINIQSAPDVEGRATAALSDWGATLAPQELLCAIDANLGKWIAVWHAGAGFPAVRAAWLARAHGLGTALCVQVGTEAICGTFAGIDETGALLLASVEPNHNDISRFTYGDVSLPPPRAIEGSTTE